VIQWYNKTLLCNLLLQSIRSLLQVFVESNGNGNVPEVPQLNVIETDAMNGIKLYIGLFFEARNADSVQNDKRIKMHPLTYV
jgi:hypothetical protein